MEGEEEDGEEQDKDRAHHEKWQSSGRRPTAAFPALQNYACVDRGLGCMSISVCVWSLLLA